MICKYVDQKDLAAILTSVLSAGVAPEGNPRTDITRSLKRGTRYMYQFVSSKKFKTNTSALPQKPMKMQTTATIQSIKHFLRRVNYLYICSDNQNFSQSGSESYSFTLPQMSLRLTKREQHMKCLREPWDTANVLGRVIPFLLFHSTCTQSLAVNKDFDKFGATTFETIIWIQYEIQGPFGHFST